MMETSNLDPVEFRAGQRQQWAKAASGWRKWSELIERAARGVSERLVELAGVERGDRVLDVAAGYGEPTLTAAMAAGPEGEVVATDISAEMIAFGRERAGAAGLGNIEFVESDAASLEFSDGSFDAALSRWGIIFEPDAETAAAHVRGFLEPGARMAISSRGQPDRVPFMAIPMRTAMQRLDASPPPPGTPGPLSRPTPAALGGLLDVAGFLAVDVAEARVTFEWRSPEDPPTYIREVSSSIKAIIDPHPPDVQEETWAAITDAIGQEAADDGSVRLTNLVLLAAGRA